MPKAKNIIIILPSAFIYHSEVSSVMGHNGNKWVWVYNIFSDTKHFNIKLYLSMATDTCNEMCTHQIVCISFLVFIHRLHSYTEIMALIISSCCTVAYKFFEHRIIFQ